MKTQHVYSTEVPWAALIHEDPVQLAVLSELTRQAGLEHLTFQDAATALEFLDPKAPPTFVVTDVYMSSLDAWRLCRLMHSPEYAPFNQVPILAVSPAFAGEDPKSIAADLGADAYLSTPIHDHVFVEIVHQILAGTIQRTPTRALIVEDDPDVSTFLQRVFSDNGYQADVVTTLREATAADAHDDYDVALIDYRLPDGDGDTLLDHLHAHRPECICLMFTGDPSAELSLNGMKRGAAACVTKRSSRQGSRSSG